MRFLRTIQPHPSQNILLHIKRNDVELRVNLAWILKNDSSFSTKADCYSTAQNNKISSLLAMYTQTNKNPSE